jgi:leucyl-tRNA synthetase
VPAPAPTAAEEALVRHTHDVVRAVTFDMERLQPNTCLMSLIKFVYYLETVENRPCAGGPPVGERAAFHDALCTLLRLLAPFAPHLAEEIWERLGMPATVAESSWPRAADAPPGDAMKRIAVKVNGELVARLQIPVDAPDEQLMRMAQEHGAVQARLEGRDVSRQIYVRDQVINLVT